MIEVCNLTKTHLRGETEVRALRELSCQFAPGSMTFVVGPSGSGKSTLLYLLGALDHPTSGHIVVDDQDITQFNRAQRDDYRRLRVGFVFQSFNLLNNLDAVDNVLVPFMPRGINSVQRQRAQQLLERVGLTQRLHHRPKQLSGGEQQRVAIARALFKEPSILLADEPTGELDSSTGAEVFSHLRRVHREQKTTVVVVTHDPRYIEAGDNVIRLRDGQLETASNGDRQEPAGA
jgi:putative ABC transport system ATP-binding protein